MGPASQPRNGRSTRLLLPTLRHYQPAWLGADVLAGLTLVAIALPEQMATSRLAGLPPAVGLYAFLAGSVTFALLGRSARLSVGADSTIAPVMAAGVAALGVTGTAAYGQRVSYLALMVGVLVVVVGLLRLGWIAEFLSRPVITGILGGIAVQIFVRQLPAVLGLAGGGSTTVGRLRVVAGHLGDVNGWAVVIAAGVFAVVLGAETVDRRIPGALIGLVGSIVVATAFDLKAHGVALIGAIHGGLPSFGLPSASWPDGRRLVGPALTVTFLCLAQTAATISGSSDAGSSVEDFDRDLLAVGVGSLVAGLSGSFAVNTSPPRSEIVAASGGRSQASGLVAAAVVLLVMLAATGLLQDLPEATLGAILVFVATRLFRIGELRSIGRFDRVEFGLAVVTLLAVAVVGIEQGVAIAMLLSLADRTWRTARPRDAVLGRVPGTDHWIPSDVGPATEHVPGVVVYLVYGPLWYGNADYIAERLRHLVAAVADAEPVRGLVLDADAMSDIDYTGARTLGALADELRRQGVAVAIARSSHLVHHDLKHSGVLRDIGAERLFATVEDAVAALARRP